jgi:threonine dehydratase
MKATIVMPEDVSIRKLLAVKEYGAEVILFGKQFGEAYKRAEELSKQAGKIMIPAFADPHVIAGQGTVGLEIWRPSARTPRWSCRSAEEG